MKTWQRFTLYTLYIIMFGVSFFCYIITLLSCENANLVLFTGLSMAVFMFFIIFIASKMSFLYNCYKVDKNEKGKRY